MPTKEVKQRSKETTDAFNAYKTYDHMQGSEQLVWVSGMEEKNKDQLMGHTKNYTKVVMKQLKEGIDHKELFGKLVKVKVLATSKWHCEGEIIDYAPAFP